MKFMRIAVAAALAFAWSNAQAFHSGGVAECGGCHSMHNSLGGLPNVTGRAYGTGAGPWLLKAVDQSGACLNCHQGAQGGYRISTSGILPLNSSEPIQRTAGGDFSWLKKTMTYSVRGTLNTMDGDVKGHNIVAADFGFTADKTLTVAPGGTYPAASLACSSCHDPHGRYRRDATGAYATTGLPIFSSGSYATSAAPIAGVSAVGAYRILAGVGYQPKSLAGSFAFASNPPTAISPSSYNANQTTIAGTATGSDRVGYGSGMSEYCGNCHTGMHQDTYTSGTLGLVHPAGDGAKLTAPIAANYSAYVSSGIMTGTGAQYSALAPFETGDTATLAGITALKAFQAAPTAAATTSNVLCLSCHRAHASGFESMTRFNLVNEFMTIADAANAAIYDSSTTEGKINTGYTTGLQVAAYNGRPATLFGPYARVQCNKCHAKD